MRSRTHPSFLFFSLVTSSNGSWGVRPCLCNATELDPPTQPVDCLCHTAPKPCTQKHHNAAPNAQDWATFDISTSTRMKRLQSLVTFCCFSLFGIGQDSEFTSQDMELLCITFIKHIHLCASEIFQAQHVA